MPYQPIYRYALLLDPAYSAYSRPRRDHENGSYEIHLIKSGNPSYIPADFEVWPIYYNAIMKAQCVPCTPWRGRKTSSRQASKGKAAAKAVRTATKLSYRVTERYGAGYQLATGNKSKEIDLIPAATQPSASPPDKPKPPDYTAPPAAPHSAGPPPQAHPKTPPKPPPRPPDCQTNAAKHRGKASRQHPCPRNAPERWTIANPSPSSPSSPAPGCSPNTAKTS